MPDAHKFTHRIWISPEGEVIEMPIGVKHSNYSQQYYKQQDIDLNPPEAMEQFFIDGWIRVQIGQDNISLEGKEASISANGDLVFSVEPNFKTLIFSFTDTGNYKRVIREMVEGWSWGSIVKEAKKGEIFFGE